MANEVSEARQHHFASDRRDTQRRDWLPIIAKRFGRHYYGIGEIKQSAPTAPRRKARPGTGEATDPGIAGGRGRPSKKTKRPARRMIDGIRTM